MQKYSIQATEVEQINEWKHVVLTEAIFNNLPEQRIMGEHWSYGVGPGLLVLQLAVCK